MADLFDGYGATAARTGSVVAFDEIFTPDSQVRLPYRQIRAALAADVARRATRSHRGAC